MKKFFQNKNIILVVSVVMVIFFLTGSVARATTEIIRPNGAGSETAIPTQYPSSTSHWDKVDEATADGLSTYVINDSGSAGWLRDLYAMSDHATGSGTINSVTVYAVITDGSYGGNYEKISIRTHNTTYDTGANWYGMSGNWTTASNVWTTNPNTSSSWTWAEVDALEAGISLYHATGGFNSILPGQPILMADGSQKNIEDIRVGDEIISFNLNSNKTEKDVITYTTYGYDPDYLVFNGTLKTSLKHVIWANDGFKTAKDIKLGDFLLNSQGQKVEVTQIEYFPETVLTYDLEVQNNHNFFVDNYLVHNAVGIGVATQVYAVVDYTAPTNSAPVPTSVTVSSNAIKYGSAVTFTGNWTEANAGDNDKMYVCKNASCTNCNSTTQTGCYCYSASNNTQPDTTDTCSYTSNIFDLGSHSYWLNVCDTGGPACSATFKYGGTFKVGFSASLQFIKINKSPTSKTTVSASPSKAKQFGIDYGLIGWWTMDGPDVNWVTNKIIDRSGNGRTGTLTGLNKAISTIFGKIGQAFKFNGTTSRISTSTGVDLSAAGSVSFWFKPTTLSGATSTIFSDVISATNQYAVILVANTITGTYTDASAHSKSGTVANTNWHQVLFTWNGAIPALYLDGVAQ